MENKTDWTIRSAIPADLHFIYSTWLNAVWMAFSQCDTCRYRTGLRKAKFFLEYPNTLDSILGNPDTHVAVATKIDEPLVIFGYVVYDSKSIHFIFTKDHFRKTGIGTSLYNYAKGKRENGETSKAN